MKIEKGWAFPDADVFMVNELKDDGTYQASHLHAALAYVTDFSCAIDGGAHIGTWSKIMSGRFQQVIAVEPSPDTFEALLWNMSQFVGTESDKADICVGLMAGVSSFSAGNIHLRNRALGAAAGMVSMHLDARAEQMQNTGARYVMPGGSIPMETIDSWELPSLGLLKLDVEGSEVAALTGAKATLLRCQPIVVFENKNLWSRYGIARDAPQHFLRSVGYRELSAVSRDAIWGPL